MSAGFDRPPTSAMSSRIAAKVTVNLSQKTYEALERAASITGDTKTDVINKAVQLYSEVREAQNNGGGVWLQASEGTDPVKVRLF